MTLRERGYSLLFMTFASFDVGLALNAAIGLATFGLLIAFAYWFDLLLGKRP